MPEVAFVCSRGQSAALWELAQTIAFELERQDVDPTHHLTGFPEVRADRVYVLVDPPTYLAHEGEAALPDDAVLRRTVLLWISSAPAPDDLAALALLERAGAVFVLDARVQVAMQRLQVPARLMRPGYSSSLDRYRDPTASRPIDLLFCGEYSVRRARVLARGAEIFDRHETVIELSDPDVHEDDASRQRRWEQLTTAKVVMNLHRDGVDRLEWREVLDAVHAGAAVVSEHASGISPFEVGEHLLVGSADALPFVADVLVRDDARRERQRAAAYERLRRWIPFALPVSVLRAAIVELVGEPSPPDAACGRSRAPEESAGSHAGRPSAPADGVPGEGPSDDAHIQILRLRLPVDAYELSSTSAEWSLVLGANDRLLPRAKQHLAAAVAGPGVLGDRVVALQPMVAVADDHLLGWRVGSDGMTTSTEDICLPLMIRTERLRDCRTLDEAGIRDAASEDGWRIRRLPRILATRA